MDQTTLSAIVSYFGAGGVLLVFVAAAGKGLLAWKAERTAQTPNEIANSQLAAFQSIADQANRRADGFAAERNELLVKVTRFEGELERLKDVVAHNERLEVKLERQEEEMRQLIEQHNKTVAQMLDVVQGLKDHLAREATGCRLMSITTPT